MNGCAAAHITGSADPAATAMPGQLSIDMDAEKSQIIERWLAVAINLVGAKHANLLTSELEQACPSSGRTDISVGEILENPACLGIPLPAIEGLRRGKLVVYDRNGRVWTGSDVAVLGEVASALAAALGVLAEKHQRAVLEAQLRDQVDLYRALIEASSEIVWKTDPHGAPLEPSPTWQKFTGQSTEHWLGFGWMQVVHPEDQGRLRSFWARGAVEGRPQSIEYRLRHHAGSWHWMHERAVPLLSASGQLKGWVGMSSDINERRKADETLRTGEARHRALVEAMSVMTWSAGPDGLLTEGTAEKWCDFTGQSLEDWQARKWLQVVHPDDCDRVRQHWFQHGGTPAAIEYEYRLWHKSGEWRWVLERIVPMYDSPLGTLQGWVGMTSDIHDRKSVEIAREESESRYRALVEASSQFVWTADANGQFNEDCPSWRKLTGISKEAWLRNEWINDVHPDDAPALLAAWKAALQEGTKSDLEFRVRNRNGEWRDIAEKMVSLRNEAGGVQGWVGMSSDVTEQKLANLARHDSERMLRQALKAAHMLAWTCEVSADKLSLSCHDAEGSQIAGANESMSDLFARMGPADTATLRNAIHRSAQMAQPFELVMALTDHTGAMRWIGVHGQADASAGSPSVEETILGKGVFRDVTDSRKAEESRNLLVGEIAHRGKNLLAIVQSMAGITINDSRPVTESRRMFLERLGSLARSHSMLTQQDWEGVPIDEIVRMELANHGDRAAVDVAPVLLNPSSAQNVALVTHELVTNAAKHGALSGQTGGVSVRGELSDALDGPVLRFTWQEHDGPIVKAPERTGFGSMLLRRLIQGFDTAGVIEYRPEGLFIQIDMPLDMITPNHARLDAAIARAH